MKYLFSIFIIIFFILWTFATPGRLLKTNAEQSNKLEGIWKVDSAFNENMWNKNIKKGVSHEWYEILTFKKDSFFLEEHEWWPPHTETDGKEYFAANFTNYILGTLHIQRDTIALDGYYTDYLYSAKVDRMYKYNSIFRYNLNSDTLELMEYSFLKQRMIRRK